jgi:hypothetical protein
MNFFLGTHEPSWLARTNIPLFISYNRLIRYKALPRANNYWAMDSGAFTQLANHGRWTISSREYADSVADIALRIGKLKWASIQDWLCSPLVLQATGLTIEEHQSKTIRSLIDLRESASHIHWIPVLQGWDVKSYLDHFTAYRAYGLQLENEPLVGVGSLANRKGSPEVFEILSELKQRGLKTHAFGLSNVALNKVHPLLESADSLAWSFIARRRKIKYHRCEGSHSVCNNCLAYAKSWHKQVLNCIRY